MDPPKLLRKTNGNGSVSTAQNAAGGKSAIDRTSGNAAAPSQASSEVKSAKTKPAAEGTKVTIRRLPPSMTEEEFVHILGEKWKVGNGKVDWMDFTPGKMAKT
jgi:regulator of nonsense transcripts 3